MHDIISSGRALYWGTSEWSATAVLEHGRSPIATTCTSGDGAAEYNLFERDKVEREFARSTTGSASA